MEQLRLFNINVQRHLIEIPGIPSSVGLDVVGSLRQSLEQNQRDLGIYNAGHLITAINQAKQTSLYVAFDMPTGATPKSTWNALRKAIEEGGVDLSRVIWFGHEADFYGPPNSNFDYEQQRLHILQKLGVSIQPIIEPIAAAEPVLHANYVPMHLYRPRDDSITSIKSAARNSMVTYDQILHTLLKRKDVLSLGFHGVGKDSHGFGELQLFHMWQEAWKLTAASFITPIENYRYRNGLWRLPDGKGGYEIDNNALGEQLQNYPELQLLAGLGRNVLTGLDTCLEIFNDQKKYPAFRTTLQALRENIRSASGDIINNNFQQPEREELLPLFIEYATKLQDAGKLQPSDYQKAGSCFKVMQLISQSWIGESDETVYYPLWSLITRYFGSETPVSRVIKERAAIGKKTTMVLPADVVRDTELESLAMK